MTFKYIGCLVIVSHPRILQKPGKFFKIKFFFSLPGEDFLIKKKKKVFMKNLPGASNIILKDKTSHPMIAQE
jgi:hypothetical protein